MGTAWRQATAGTYLKVTALLFIPIIGPMIIAGWTAEITKRTALGVPNVVPPLKFDALGYWIKRGIPPYISTLVYTTVASFVSSFFMIPVYIGVMLAGEFLGSGPLMAVFMIFGFGFMLLNTLLLAVLGNAASTIADMSGDMNQAFNLKLVKQYVYGTIGPSLKMSLGVGVVVGLLAIPAMMLFVVPYLMLLGFAFVANGVGRGLIHQRYVGLGHAPIGVEPPEFMPGEAVWQQPHLLVDSAGQAHPSWAPPVSQGAPVGAPWQPGAPGPQMWPAYGQPGQQPPGYPPAGQYPPGPGQWGQPPQGWAPPASPGAGGYPPPPDGAHAQVPPGQGGWSAGHEAGAYQPPGEYQPPAGYPPSEQG